MDCPEFMQRVWHAFAALLGVETVNVFLASDEAAIQLDPRRVDLPTFWQAVSSGAIPFVPYG